MKLLAEIWVDAYADNTALEQSLAPLPKRWPRYAPDMKACWLATGLALRSVSDVARERIGCVACGTDGCHAANRAYFADYLAGGRQLGRSALFIHTLPTATLAECALHFALGGPLLYAIAEDGRSEDAFALCEVALAQDNVDMVLLIPCTPHRIGCMALVRGDGFVPQKTQKEQKR